jgi:uridine kinase
MAAPGPVRLVGIDGCGGAGKTTFAARLAAALEGAPVVHTDDFASHDEPINWWPRFVARVVEPLQRGVAATFHPYDWVNRRRSDELIVILPSPVVLIEGVAATREAWRDMLSMRIWVDAPRDLRLERGIERDGEELRAFWDDWMRAEDDYVLREDPLAHADLVVDGAPDIPYDEDREFVELTGLNRPRGSASRRSRPSVPPLP